MTRGLKAEDFDSLSLCPRGEPPKAIESFFVAACRDVIARVPAGQGAAGDRARAACGFPGSPSMQDLVGNVRQIAKVVTATARPAKEVKPPNDPKSPQDVLVAALTLLPQAEQLADWNFDDPFGCDGTVVFVQRVLHSIPKTKLAMSALMDSFPRKYGFSPDGSPLPHGERTRWQARADFSHVSAAWEIALGGGVGASRSEPSGEFKAVVTPSITLTRSFSLLRGRPLWTKLGLLNLDEQGNLPPHLALGISASAEVALDRPSSQTTSFNEVKIQPYLDFFLNEKISFRLGIPVRAEIVERKAVASKPPVPPAVEGTPAIPAQRSLQWTVPVVFVTVLKL